MMQTYISILRGINVSGQKLIKMDALKSMYESLGFTHVKNYVQSGNIIFSADETATKSLVEKISSQIENDFGFEVPVLVMTKNELEEIIAANPFADSPEKDPTALYVTFLAANVSDFDLDRIEEKAQKDEQIYIGSKAVYLYCPHGYGKTKLNNTFLERSLKTKATTRNWKTTKKLLELAVR
ncbi:DUF1697 domain-containing protein [Albibacterium indicum]|uniref:DUF1697 domain-containing protein n=1 Tax=Albibacterium indicum TaxID=2292082 RepID=UPI000E4D59F0|nr:DUF1697 domain-containing protein [Pedobacter indicus]